MSRNDLVPRSKLHSARLRRGFKAGAKRRAAGAKDSVGIPEDGPLEPIDLAARLGVSVFSVAQIGDGHLRAVRSEEFSGLLLRTPDGPVIIYNDEHHPVRQRSTICHELGHFILQHEATPVLNDFGLREFQVEVEAEAEYMGSVLLVSEGAVMKMATSGVSIEEAAAHYDVSVQLMRWRFNAEGTSQRTKLKYR